MKSEQYITSNVFNYELDLNGIEHEKFWQLPVNDRKLILNRYAACLARSPNISNRRFNPNVHAMIVNRKKRAFFDWITTLQCYEKIKRNQK